VRQTQINLTRLRQPAYVNVMDVGACAICVRYIRQRPYIRLQVGVHIRISAEPVVEIMKAARAAVQKVRILVFDLLQCIIEYRLVESEEKIIVFVLDKTFIDQHFQRHAQARQSSGECWVHEVGRISGSEKAEQVFEPPVSFAGMRLLVQHAGEIEIIEYYPQFPRATGCFAKPGFRQ
jgi:hypothetical protein